MSDTSVAYEFDDDPARIDRDVVWTFMVEQAPWGRWRTREILERQIDVSWRVVGAYERATGAMVGFARAVSDGISLAYVADVFVCPEHRGHGLGLGVMRTLIEDSAGPHFRWMLHTDTAHGLYAKLGFAEPGPTYLERPGGAPTVASAGG